MTLKNTSGIDTEVVREVLRFAMPPGVTKVRVTVTKKTGWAAYSGWGCRNSILCRLNKKTKFPFWYQPYQYGDQKGCRWLIRNMTELLVVLAAHELRHSWQARQRTRRGYVWGARGRFSEVDTEAYALKTLRAWRRRPVPVDMERLNRMKRLCRLRAQLVKARAVKAAKRLGVA